MIITFYSPELLGDEALDGLVALHHKAKGGELTAAVADDVSWQLVWEDAL